MSPYTVNRSILFHPAVPASPPIIGTIRRTSATDIEVSWEPLTPEQSMGVVTAYLVRYRITEDEIESSGRRVRRNANNLTTVIETTDTNIVISDLDPRIVYAVSVAARTDAGVGNYSQETVVGCKLGHLQLASSPGPSQLFNVAR